MHKSTKSQQKSKVNTAGWTVPERGKGVPRRKYWSLKTSFAAICAGTQWLCAGAPNTVKNRIFAKLTQKSPFSP
jgi:hypothetical protein